MIKTIYYELDTPTVIACIGGVFSSENKFASFEWDCAGRMSHITHEISWSGNEPGDGDPTVIPTYALKALAESIRIAKEEALMFRLDEVDVQTNALLVDSETNLFEYKGNSFYQDEKILLLGFVSATIDPDITMQWKTADKTNNGVDNIYVTLDAAGIFGLVAAYIAHVRGIWNSGDAEKKALKAIYSDNNTNAVDIDNYKVMLKNKGEATHGNK